MIKTLGPILFTLRVSTMGGYRRPSRLRLADLPRRPSRYRLALIIDDTAPRREACCALRRRGPLHGPPRRCTTTRRACFANALSSSRLGPYPRSFAMPVRRACPMTGYVTGATPRRTVAPARGSSASTPPSATLEGIAAKTRTMSPVRRTRPDPSRLVEDLPRRSGGMRPAALDL